MPAKASRERRPASSNSHTPSPRSNATGKRAYVFITCDMATPSKHKQIRRQKAAVGLKTRCYGNSPNLYRLAPWRRPASRGFLIRCAPSAGRLQPSPSRAPQGAVTVMRNTIQSFIIIGVTSGGKTFRPSDWADRLCGIMSAFGSDNRMMYSPYVRPGCSLKGDKTVLVDARLHDIEPLAYNFLVNFAKDNDLQVEQIGRASCR